MFIRQLIIQLLVLNIVFSNFAWAIDECAYNFSDSNRSEFLITADQFSNHYQRYDDQLVDNDADNSTSTNVNCDSHCFANVQLIYVAFHLNDIQFLNNYSNINSRQVPWHSINAQPPVKPPRV